MEPHKALLLLVLAASCTASGNASQGLCAEDQCADNQACIDGACRQVCLSADQCEAGQGCNLGICDACTRDEDCTNNYACDAPSGVCAQDCGDDSQCDVRAFCAGGTCQPLLNVGSGCDANSQCVSENCASGQCCPSDCTQGCNGNLCLQPIGAACAGGVDCVSGVCAQGVCCSDPCDGLCESCAVVGSLGSCQPTPFAQTTGCAITSAGAKMCDGTGQCRSPRQVGDINQGGGPSRMLALSNGSVLFDAPHPDGGREPWAYNDGQATWLLDTEPGWPSGFAASEQYLLGDGSTALLVSRDSVFGVGFWVTDGTLTGSGLASLELMQIDEPVGTTTVDGKVFLSSFGMSRTWRIDGTASGSGSLLGSTIGGTAADAGGGFVALGGRVLFLAKSAYVFQNYNYSRNLFALSDSAAEPDGTELCPGSIHGITNLTLMGDVVVFGVSYRSGSAYDDRLYRYDPTSVGTECALLSNIETVQRSYPTPAVQGASDRVYFLGQPTVSDPVGLYMWKSSVISAVDVSDTPISFERVWQDRLYFRAGTPQRLYVHDGVAAPQDALDGATPVAGGIGTIVTTNAWMYVTVDEPTLGAEPWRTRGVGASLEVENLDLWPGTSASGPLFLAAFDSQAFLAASIPGAGRELVRWQENGQAHAVIELAGGEASSYPSAAVVADGELILSALRDDARYWIWTMSTATSPPEPRALIGPGDASSVRVPSMADLGDGVAYCADDGVVGHELWVSDAGGSRRVRDLGPGLRDGCLATPTQKLVSMGSWVLFAGNDNVHGAEPFASDGTSVGTVLLEDINPSGDGFAGGGLALGDHVVFVADSGTATELWASAGTPASTQVISSLGAGADPRLLGASADWVFFAATSAAEGRELWATAGTASSTVRLSDFSPGASDGLASSPPATVHGDQLFVVVGSGPPCEIWQSAGGAPILAAAIDLGCAAIRDLRRQGQTLFVIANDQVCSFDLGSSTPTAACTLELEPGSSTAEPAFLGTLPDAGLFAWTVLEVGREVWATNGTASGTALLADFNPGAPSSVGTPVAADFAGRVFLAAETNGQSVLWSTQGNSDDTWRACGDKALCRDVRGLVPLRQRLGLFFDDGHGAEPGVFP